MSGMGLRDWLKSPVARRRAAYRATFGTPSGQRVLEDLLKFCNVSQSSVVLGDNGQGTAENEGKRRVAMRITKFLNMSNSEVMRLAQRSAEDGEDPDDED